MDANADIDMAVSVFPGELLNTRFFKLNSHSYWSVVEIALTALLTAILGVPVNTSILMTVCNNIRVKKRTMNIIVMLFLSTFFPPFFKFFMNKH